jgi:hypothetical protein
MTEKSPLTVIIFPDGDVIITLIPATLPFAVWPLDEAQFSNDQSHQGPESPANDIAVTLEESEMPDVPETVRFLVSEKHLCHVCPYVTEVPIGTQGSQLTNT